MSTAIATTFDSAKLAVALKQLAREHGAGTGATAFLKMEKGGSWVFGLDGNEVEDDECFYVHPGCFQHGYIAWDARATGNRLGEMMGPVTEPLPPVGPVPDNSNGWQFQLGVGLVLAEESLPLTYRTTSVGGRRAIVNIAEEIQLRLANGDPACVPVVTLTSDPYMHKQYGKIHNPVFAIQEWVTLATLDAAIAGEAHVPKALAAPVKKTSRHG